MAALAAGAALGIPGAELAPAIASYTGVKRRLQLKGEEAGVQVVDSYAPPDRDDGRPGGHARGCRGPHPGGLPAAPVLRTQELAKEMGESLALADASIVLDIYAAREDPIPGVAAS